MHDLEGLLADEAKRGQLAHAVQSGEPPPYLRDAKIKLTSRCNLRCRMCHYGLTRAEESLDTDSWRRVLDQLAALGCRKLHLSGGEPLLRRDLVELVEHAVASGIKTNLTSNGTLIDKGMARRLARSGLNAVSVSLDAPSARLHDLVRGQQGAFHASVRALRLLKRFGAERNKPLRLRINMVVMRDNYRRIPDMLRLAGELGVDDLVPMPIDEVGEGRQRLSGRQIARYNEEIAPQVEDLRRRYGFDLRAERVFPFGVERVELRHAKRGGYARGRHLTSPCLAPWLHLFIAWDGRVYPCCMTVERVPPLGDLRHDTLAAIWRGEGYRLLRRAMLAGMPPIMCHRCDLFVSENDLALKAIGLGQPSASTASTARAQPLS